MASERYILYVPEQVNGTTGFNKVHKSCQAQSAIPRDQARAGMPRA